MAQEISFTYNERDHAMILFTDKIARQIAFIVYVPVVSFKDGEFLPKTYKCQADRKSVV